MKIPNIDQNHVVAELLAIERDLMAKLAELLHPVARQESGFLETARRMLAGGPSEAPDANGAKRQHEIEVIRAALAEIAPRIRDARNASRRAIVAELKLADKAATHRQKIADAADTLLAAMLDAETFLRDLDFQDIHGDALNAGVDIDLIAMLALRLHELRERGAKVRTDKRTLMLRAGLMAEADATAGMCPRTADPNIVGFGWSEAIILQ